MLITLGSLFLQVFCWAVYSLLEMKTWMCGLSVIVSALMYHFVQTEEQKDLSRRSVFFAAILLPFLLAAGITVIQLVKYPALELMSATADGVSPLTELVSLYAARLMLNGAVLLLFAPVDRLLRHGRTEQNEKTA